MNLTRDIAMALRDIRRRPGLPIVIVLSLGFALGINTSLFSLFNAAWLTPWPVAGARDIRVIDPPISIAELRDWSAQSRSWSGLSAKAFGRPARHAGQVARYDVVTANYFTTLGVSLQAGRGFSPSDEADDAEAVVAVVSHHFWQTRLGADPDVIGRSLTLDPADLNLESIVLTIVGVAAPGFDGPDSTRRQLWLPISALRHFQPVTAGQADTVVAPQLRAFGRLRPGVSAKEAQAELISLSARYRAQYSLAPTPISVRTTDQLSQSPPQMQTRVSVVSLLAGIALVTLIACANVSNLLLARGHARRSEIATRLALGATRSQVVRQLLTENLVLALAAAWLGLMLAMWLPEAVFRAMNERTSFDLGESIQMTFAIDGRVVAWAMVTAVIACVALGLAPALKCTAGSVGEVLKDANHVPGRATLSPLLGYQTAVSVMAMAIAGLVLRSEPVTEAKAIERATSGVTIVSLGMPRDLAVAERRVVSAAVAEQLAAMSGNRQVAGMSGVSRPGAAPVTRVTPGYFDMLRMPWISGRTFLPSDPDGGVMVVNERFAQRHWPGQAAIGKTVDPQDPRTRELAGRRVVGVVADAQLLTATAYLPAETSDLSLFFVSRPRDLILRVVPATVSQLNRSVTVRVFEGSQWIAPAAMSLLISAYVTLAFGAGAMLLGALGFFSLLEYSVRQRTREMGVRMTLGAGPADIVRALVQPPVRALIRGAVFGNFAAGAIAVIVNRAGLPRGVNPLDPITYVAVAAALLMVGALAAYLPARRALRIAPSEALRVN